MASAAKTLIRGTCKDRVAMVINALAAVAVLLYPATWMFPLVIVLGEAGLLQGRARAPHDIPMAGTLPASVVSCARGSRSPLTCLTYRRLLCFPSSCLLLLTRQHVR